jgi:hypothetical protein
MPGKAHRLGPYSTRKKAGTVDGRTREALLRRVRADLTKHVGGNPSATQQALIERAAWLSLHIALLDERTVRTLAKARDGRLTRDEMLAAGATLSESDSRQYLAWTNSLAKVMGQLGSKGMAPRPAEPKAYEDLIREQAERNAAILRSEAAA